MNLRKFFFPELTRVPWIRTRKNGSTGSKKGSIINAGTAVITIRKRKSIKCSSCFKISVFCKQNNQNQNRLLIAEQPIFCYLIYSRQAESLFSINIQMSAKTGGQIFLPFFGTTIPKCPLPVGTSEGILLRQTVFSKKFFCFFWKTGCVLAFQFQISEGIKFFWDLGGAFGCSQWE